MKNTLLFFLFLNYFIAQEEFFINIPSTSYTDWIYFSLSQNSIIEIEDPENSLDWDLAFQRKHIRTNSGLSGPGNGGAFVDSSMTWIDNWGILNEIPEDVEWLEDTLLPDFYDLQTHTFYEDIKNPALNAWGWFNDMYQLITNDYVIYAKCANGEDVVKFWAYDYYLNNAGGNISIRYQTGLVSSQCTGIVGDVNNDANINVVDVVSLVSYVLEDIDLSECDVYYSDLNNDLLVNVVDVVNLVSFILD